MPHHYSAFKMQPHKVFSMSSNVASFITHAFLYWFASQIFSLFTEFKASKCAFQPNPNALNWRVSPKFHKTFLSLELYVWRFHRPSLFSIVCSFILVCYHNHQIHFKHPINCYATNNRDLNKARTPHICNKMHTNTHTDAKQKQMCVYSFIQIWWLKEMGFGRMQPKTDHSS